MSKRFWENIWRWLGDKFIEHWPAMFTVVVGGGGMTYLANITSFLDPYSPVAWGGVGIITILVLSLAYFLFQVAKSRRALVNYVTQKSDAHSINVLEPIHRNERIDISVFYHPCFYTTDNFRFENCQLVGPAFIYLMNPIFDGYLKMIDCEVVILRSDRNFKGITAFRNCSFINCNFYRVTLGMTIEAFNASDEQVRKSMPVISDGRVGDV